MSIIRKSTRIQAPVEMVYEFASHPENLPGIWPSLVEVANVERSPDGAHHFDWTYKMAGIRFHGHSDSIEAELNRHLVDKSVGGIPNTFDWTYTAAGDATIVELEVSYELPATIFHRLARPLLMRRNEREAETLLENLKARLEQPQK